MRILAVAGVVCAFALTPVAASAQPHAQQFDTYCTPTDPGLEELSGLTSIDGVLYAIGDSGNDHRVAVLDDSCAVSRWLEVPVDPYDVEDMASYDGQLWLSDTGDNQRRRDTVALTRMDPATGQGELYRLVYPDGPHDAETVLIEPGGRPVIVTKEPSGVSGLYVPEFGQSVGELASPGPTPMKKVGERAFDKTDTAGGPPFVTGSILATGGAVSADGAVAAVRTYTDVYLFRVTDGDVVGALTGEPVVTALPEQPQGEAVTFDAAGSLLVASEAGGVTEGLPLPPVRMLTDATALVPAAAATASTESSSSGRWSIGAIAVAGVLALVSVLYVFGIARKRS